MNTGWRVTMTPRILGATLASAMLLSGSLILGQAPSTEPAAAPTAAAPVTLPPGITWETNNDDPIIGSEQALRGGTFNYYIQSYPLTFRLMGPNSNDAFAGWNRLFTMN